MSYSLLLDHESDFSFSGTATAGGTAISGRGIKLSWMVISSFSLHLFLFLGLFLFAPRSIPDRFLLQDYQVSLISPKLLETKLPDIGTNGVSGVSMPIPAPLPPVAPTPVPVPMLEKVIAPVKNSEVTMEIPKSVSTVVKEIPEKINPLPPAKFYPETEAPVVPKFDTASKIPPPLELPSSPNEGKTAPPVGVGAPEKSVLPSVPVLPEINGLSASLSTGGAGSGEGTSPTGSAFGYPYYLRSIEHKVGNQWVPPPAAPMASKKARSFAVIGFNVKQNGRIDVSSVSVEKSSGDSFFDMAALRAVHNANPLPPLPRGIFDNLRVHFSFSVSLDS